MKEEPNRRTKEIKNDIPAEFQRKMRGTNKFAKYKAVDLKFTSQYAAPFVFKKWLYKDLYNHFMKLSISLRLLSIKNAMNYTDFAQRNLKEFVDEAKTHYGTNFMSLSVHSLCHLTDDVIVNRCNLNYLSAFSFESYLVKVFKSFRSAINIVAQFCRRSVEEEKFAKKLQSISKKFQILQKRK